MLVIDQHTQVHLQLQPVINLQFEQKFKHRGVTPQEDASQDNDFNHRGHPRMDGMGCILLFFLLGTCSIHHKLGCQPGLLAHEIKQKHIYLRFKSNILSPSEVVLIILTYFENCFKILKLYYYFLPILLLNFTKTFHPILFIASLYVYYVMSKCPQLYYYLGLCGPILLLNFKKNSNLYFYSGLYVYSELQSNNLESQQSCLTS